MTNIIKKKRLEGGWGGLNQAKEKENHESNLHRYLQQHHF